MSILGALRLPDLFTLLNALLGFTAVLAACWDDASTAVMLILSAAVADGLDGFMARRMGSSVLGPNLDSMADLISFGVAPAALAAELFKAVLPFPSWSTQAFSAIFCGIFLICGTLRLARFNVMPKSELCFEGLPIPAAGIIASASVLLNQPLQTAILMLLLSALMVSSIPYPKIRDLQIAAPLAIVFLAAAYLIWSGNAPNYSAILFYAAAASYLISPVVLSCPKKER